MRKERRGEIPPDLPREEPTVMGERVRFGYPFDSVEQLAIKRVNPFSNFRGGSELVAEEIEVEESEFREKSPEMTRLVKPASGPDRAQ
jgi:hypothetical protein